MDETNLATLAGVIRGVTYNAYLATLVGCAPKPVLDLAARFKPLEVGSLVMEITTIWMHDRDLNAVGYLLEKTREPVDFKDPDFVWDEEAEGRPHPDEPIFYIRTLDGRRYRWSNATFIAVPFELRHFAP